MALTASSLAAAICSRSNEEGRGSEMRRYLEGEKAPRVPRAKLLETDEGRRFVESVREAHNKLTKLLANAPVGSIATQVKKQLAEIAADLNV